MRQKPPVEVFDAPTDVSGIYPASRARRQRDLGAALIQFPRCRFFYPDPVGSPFRTGSHGGLRIMNPEFAQATGLPYRLCLQHVQSGQKRTDHRP